MNPFRSEVRAVRPLAGSFALQRDSIGESSTVGRRIVYVLVVAAIGVLSGFALAFVQPLLIVGLILSCVFVLMVMRQPYLGLMLYMVIFITRIAELYPALAPLHVERLVGMLTLVSIILAQVHREGRVLFDDSRQTHFLLWLILAAFISIPSAYWRLGALTHAINFIKILVLYIVIVELLDTKKKFRAFAILYGALIVYLGVLAIKDYAEGVMLVAQGIERAEGSTSAGGGPNEMGASMATTIPLFLLLSLHKPFRGWRILFALGLGVLLATLVMTGSRSGFLGFLTAMGYLWWTSKRKMLFGLAGVVLMVVGLVLMPAQYKGRYSTMTTSHLDGSSQARLMVWQKGLHMFIDRPLTGVGIGNFGTANAASYSGPKKSWLESHSLYVQVPAEMGLFGTFAFFSFVIEFLRVNRRAARALAADDGDWALEIQILKAMFAGSLCLLITGVFGHSLMRHTWYIYAAMGLSLWRMHLSRAESSAPAVESTSLR